MPYLREILGLHQGGAGEIFLPTQETNVSNLQKGISGSGGSVSPPGCTLPGRLGKLTSFRRLGLVSLPRCEARSQWRGPVEANHLKAGGSA